jgi:hypothetical protein
MCSYRNDFDFDIEEAVWSQLEAVQDVYPDCVVPRDPEVTAPGGYAAVSATYDYKGVGETEGSTRIFNEFIALELGAQMIVAILEWTDIDERIEEIQAIRASIRMTAEEEEGIPLWAGL